MTLIQLAKHEAGVFNVKDFSEGVGLSDYDVDTAAFQGTATEVSAYGTGGLFRMPAGLYSLNKTSRFTAFGIEIKGRGMWSTRLQFAPGSNVTTGYGSVKAASGVASFLSRPGRRIADGDRIIVGAGEYVLSGVAITPAENAACLVTLAGTVSRVANAATFTVSQAGEVENGARLSIDGAGYIVSAFSGTTTCTLLKSNDGSDATFANGSTISANRTVATLTSITGSTTFAASSFTMPEVGVFRLQAAPSVSYDGDFPQAAYLNAEGMSFIGADDTQKVAFDCHDVTRVRLRDIHVPSSWVGNKRAGANGSVLTPSIGIRTAGREMLTIDNVMLYTDRPMHHRSLVGAIDTSIDHFHFTDLLLGVQVATESAILFEGEAKGGNIIFDGQSSANGGTNGIYHKAETTASSIVNVEISNFRYEQPAVATGYAVRWDAATQQILLRNVGGGGDWSATDNNGFKFAACRKITLLNCTYTGHLEALTVDNACDDVLILNTFAQDTGTTNLVAAGFEEVWGMPKISSAAPFASTSYWMRLNSGADTTGRVKSIRINGTNVDHFTKTLAQGETYVLPLSLTGGLTTGVITLAGGSMAGASAGTVSWDSGTLVATFTVDQEQNFINGDMLLDENTGVRFTISAYNFAVSGTTCTLTPQDSATPATFATHGFEVGYSASGGFSVSGVGARKEYGTNVEVGNVAARLCVYWISRSSIQILNNVPHTLKVVGYTSWSQ